MNSRRTRPPRRVNWLHGSWNSLVRKWKTEILRFSPCGICFFFISHQKMGSFSFAVSTNMIVWLSNAGQKVKFKQKHIPERLKRISLPLCFCVAMRDLRALIQRCRLASAALCWFFLSKHFTNALAAVTTCVPWPRAAGRFVVELTGLCWSGVAGIHCVDPVLRIDARCAETRGLSFDCLFKQNFTAFEPFMFQ